MTTLEQVALWAALATGIWGSLLATFEFLSSRRAKLRHVVVTVDADWKVVGSDMFKQQRRMVLRVRIWNPGERPVTVEAPSLEIDGLKMSVQPMLEGNFPMTLEDGRAGEALYFLDGENGLVAVLREIGAKGLVEVGAEVSNQVGDLYLSSNICGIDVDEYARLIPGKKSAVIRSRSRSSR